MVHNNVELSLWTILLFIILKHVNTFTLLSNIVRFAALHQDSVHYVGVFGVVVLHFPHILLLCKMGNECAFAGDNNNNKKMNRYTND